MDARGSMPVVQRSTVLPWLAADAPVASCWLGAHLELRTRVHMGPLHGLGFSMLGNQFLRGNSLRGHSRSHLISSDLAWRHTASLPPHSIDYKRITTGITDSRGGELNSAPDGRNIKELMAIFNLPVRQSLLNKWVAFTERIVNPNFKRAYLKHKLFSGSFRFLENPLIHS